MVSTLMVMALFLLMTGAAAASDIVCGDVPNRASCAMTTGLKSYHPSVSPSAVPPGCFVIPDDGVSTAAQRALMQTDAVHVGSLYPKLYPCYLTVVGGLGVEKTLAEKQAVDAARQAELAILADKENEKTTNDFCNNLTKESIATKIDALKAAAQADIASLDANEALIDTITNIASAIVVLKQVNNAHQVVLNSLNTRYFNGFQKLAECLWARTR